MSGATCARASRISDTSMKFPGDPHVMNSRYHPVADVFMVFSICNLYNLKALGEFSDFESWRFFVKNRDCSFRILSHFFKVSRGSESFSLWRNPGR